jgi:hypothetical protein
MSGSGTPMSAVNARLTTEGAVTLARPVCLDSWLAELEDSNEALPIPVVNRAAVVARQARRQDRRRLTREWDVAQRDARNRRFLNTRSSFTGSRGDVQHCVHGLLEKTKSPKGLEDLPGFSPSVSCMSPRTCTSRTSPARYHQPRNPRCNSIFWLVIFTLDASCVLAVSRL